MIPVAAGQLLRVLATQAANPLAGAPEAPLPVPAVGPGSRVQGRVEAFIPGTGFRVEVAGQSFVMDLPASLRAGDRVELIVVAREPRPTFLLAATHPRGEPEPATLSQTARFLSALAGGTPPAQPAGVSPPPVLGTPPKEPGGWAAPLREAVTRSDLFYESHLVQWSSGERPLADVLREPQGRLSSHPAVQDPPGARASGDPPTPPAAAVERAAGESREPADPRTLQTLRGQLAALETGIVQWQGQVWTGQEMEWQIAGHPGREEDVGTMWTTRLALKLPRLGDIDASLELAGRRLRLLIRAEPAHAEALRAGAGELAAGLESAGLGVGRLEVVSGPP